MIIVLNGGLGIGKSTLAEGIATQRWLGNSGAAPDNSGAGQGVVPLLGQQFFRTRDA